MPTPDPAVPPDDPCPVGLRGIVSSVNTPFTADDRIEVEGLRRLVDYLVDCGCVGILVPAVAAEVDRLTPAERCLIVDTVLERAAGRIDVIIGLSGLDRAERAASAAEARSAGAMGVLYNPPATERGEVLEGVLGEIAALGPDLLMLQDLDWHGTGIPVDEIRRLFERVPAFQALKVEVVPAGPKYAAVLEATGGRLHVSGGWAAGQMMEGLGYGVHAFMPGGMEAVYCRIFDFYRSGNEEAARELFEQLLPVIAFANQHIDVSIRFKKRLRHVAGLFATDRCRPSVPDFDPVQEREAQLQMARTLRLEAAIGKSLN